MSSQRLVRLKLWNLYPFCVSSMKLREQCTIIGRKNFLFRNENTHHWHFETEELTRFVEEHLLVNSKARKINSKWHCLKTCPSSFFLWSFRKVFVCTYLIDVVKHNVIFHQCFMFYNSIVQVKVSPISIYIFIIFPVTSYQVLTNFVCNVRNIFSEIFALFYFIQSALTNNNCHV